jgi:hypothetical protein
MTCMSSGAITEGNGTERSGTGVLQVLAPLSTEESVSVV